MQKAGRVEGYRNGPGIPRSKSSHASDAYSEAIGRALTRLAANRRMVQIVDSEKPTVTLCRSREEIRAVTADAGSTLDGRDVVPGRTVPVAGLLA